MNKQIHTLYVGTMALTVILVTAYIAVQGYSYYTLPIEERFFHDKYDWFKPSGIMGQGLGVVGTLMIAFGVGIYIARKRYGVLEKWVRLKYLLEFHIFLCTLGPILILFHTTFKFGGIVSIAFWSMVAVVLSGVIGRFIYIQIPRTIEGRELSIQEIQAERHHFEERIKSTSGIDQETLTLIFTNNESSGWGVKSYFNTKRRISKIKKNLSALGLDAHTRKALIEMIHKEISLASKVGRLQKMQELFKYWHVVHMPFAIIMLIIVLIHVVVTISLGYKWIF